MLKNVLFFWRHQKGNNILNSSIFLWIPKLQNKEGGIWKATVLSFKTRESKIVSLSPVSFFEHKL